MALIKVSNVSKSYDGRKIIDNINLELNSWPPIINLSFSIFLSPLYFIYT